MKIGCLTICAVFSFVLCVLKLIGIISITWIQAFIPLLVWLSILLFMYLLVGIVITTPLLLIYFISKDKEVALQEINKQLDELENELKNRKW